MKLMQTLVASALLVVAGVSQAAVTDWSVHDDVEFGFGSGAGAFEDIFAFELPSAGDLSASAISTVLKPKVGVFYGSVGLYSVLDGFLGGFSFGPNTAFNFYTTPGLAAGDYYYKVSGTYTGLGSYALVSSFEPAVAVPVPEPETYAMLMAGLGAVVLARRYKKV